MNPRTGWTPGSLDARLLCPAAPNTDGCSSLGPNRCWLALVRWWRGTKTTEEILGRWKEGRRLMSGMTEINHKTSQFNMVQKTLHTRGSAGNINVQCLKQLECVSISRLGHNGELYREKPCLNNYWHGFSNNGAYSVENSDISYFCWLLKGEAWVNRRVELGGGLGINGKKKQGSVPGTLFICFYRSNLRETQSIFSFTSFSAMWGIFLTNVS